MNIFLSGRNAGTRFNSSTEATAIDSLRKSGLSISHEPMNCRGFVCIDFDNAAVRSARAAGIKRKFSVLVRNEPRIVWPQNFSQSTKSSFALIINVGRALDDELPDTQINVRWPQLWPSQDELNRFFLNSERLDSVVLLNANKLSFIHGELYSLRRTCLSKLVKIQLFGSNWDISRFGLIKIFFGEIYIAIRGRSLPRIKAAKHWFTFRPPNVLSPINKLETLSKFKYSLVIENSMEFMTEKLFDALFAGCLPIYVGPNLGSFGIPSWLAIQVDPSYESIESTLDSLESFDYEGWRRQAYDWIQDQDVIETWKSSSVFKQIAELINDFFINKQLEFIDKI